jgi:endoglucanase
MIAEYRPRAHLSRWLSVAAAIVLGAAVTAGPAWGGAAAAQTAAAAAAPDAGVAFPLHTSRSSIVDANGHSVRLHCVNWSGAENGYFVPGGLNLRPVAAIVAEIASLGYDCVRLPWSNQMWEQNPQVGWTVTEAENPDLFIPPPGAPPEQWLVGFSNNNPQLSGEPARTIFEQVVQDLASAGIMIILDNHESEAGDCCNAGDADATWYDSAYPESSWIADWKSMAAAFAGVPQVIGADLRNEPRGPATWGGPASTDWQAAAERGGDAVQSVNPDLLIFVEGVDWATNLSGVASLPVTLTDPDHVVYEAHTYDFGPATPITTYDQLMSKIQSGWGYLAGSEPLWVGEFGCNNIPGTAQDSCSDSSGDLGAWFGPLIRYFYYHNTYWSAWVLNGTTDGGATQQTQQYGVLNPAWSGVANQSLQNALASIQPHCPAAPVASGTYYLENVHSGQALTVPGGSTTEGTDLDQETLSAGDTGQEWTVDSLGCGLYEITNVATGQSIDINGQSTSDGAAVDEYDYWGGGNQQFVVSDDGNGNSVTISSINSMDPIEVPGFSTTSGTDLDQWSGNGGTNQEWNLVSG